LLENFGYVGLFLVAAVPFAIFMIVIPIILRRFGIVVKKPDPVKSSTYECGMETVGTSWVQFNFRYYFYALLFVIFDIQVVFEMMVFFFILIVGFVYAWRKKVLEWK